MSKIFKTIAFLLLICAVVFSIIFQLSLSDHANWISRVYTVLIVFVPLIAISGIFYGISNIINLLNEILSIVKKTNKAKSDE